MTDSIRKYNRDWKIYIIITMIFSLAMAFVDDKPINLAIVWIMWLCLVIVRKEVTVEWGDLLLFFGMLSYRWITNPDPVAVITGTLKIVAVYQLAKYLANPWDINGTGEDGCDNDASEWVAYVLIILSTALFVKGVLDYAYIFTDPATVWNGSWPALDPIWDIEDLTPRIMSNNMYGFNLISMGSALPFFAFVVRKNRILGTVGMILSVISIWIGMHSVGREIPVCSACGILITIVAYSVKGKLYKNRRFAITVGSIAGAIIAWSVVIKTDIAGLGQWWESHIWSKADTNYYTTRSYLHWKALTLIKNYPMGGFDDKLELPKGEPSYYSFNTWLDIAVQAGVIPFVLLLALLVVFVIALVYIIRKSNGIYPIILLSVFSGITMYHMSEPAFLSYYLFWNMEVFLGGLACGLYANISGRKGYVITAETISKGLLRLKNARKNSEQ